MRLVTLCLICLVFAWPLAPIVAADNPLKQAEVKLKELRKKENFFRTGILWPNEADRAKDWNDLWKEPVMAHVGHIDAGPEIDKINAALSPLYALYGARPDQRLIPTMIFSRQPGKPLLGSAGNYRGTVLFFDRDLILSLTAQEIRAMAGHEFGHLLPDVNSLMGQAVKNNSLVDCHIVEYLCDAVAYEASVHLGDRVDSFLTYLEKCARKLQADGFIAGPSHPDVTQRKKFAKSFFKSLQASVHASGDW